MKAIIVIASLIIIVYGVWFFAVHVGSVDVSQFKGEGRIKPVGQGFMGKGVELELPGLNSGHEKYSIKNLPVTNRDYFVSTDLPIDKESNCLLTIKVFGKSGELITVFEINYKNAICTSYEDKRQVCYTPNGFIPKDKVSDVDKMVIDHIGCATNQPFRIFLRSGGSI